MLRNDSSILDGQHLDLQAVLGGVLPDEPAQLVPHFLLVFDDSNFQHPAVSPFSVPFHLLLFIETYFGVKCNGEVRNRFLPMRKNSKTAPVSVTGSRDGSLCHYKSVGTSFASRSASCAWPLRVRCMKST